jgi:molybdate transport system substrate-binding protein
MQRHTAVVTAAAVAVLAAGCGKRAAGNADGELRVAAAANLTTVMKEVVPRFERATGNKVTLSEGSSGKLASQISEGAPFDIFLAANVGFIDEVIASGDCLADSKRVYASGRVTVWSGPDDDPPIPDTIAGLADPRYTRIAIASPDHAPYGRAAKQALERAGIWEQVKPRIIYGSNIVATIQYIENGNAEIGIIADSIARGVAGRKLSIPASSHDPIDQALAVCKGGGNLDGGRAFAEFLRAPEIRQIFADHGFSVPE